MKKILCFTGLLLLLTSDAYAQDKPNLQFSFQTGFPVTLHSDYHQNFSGENLFNYNLGFGVHYTVSSKLRTGLEFQYYNFGYDENVYRRSSTNNGTILLEAENLSKALSLMISSDFYIARNGDSAIAPFFSLDFGAARITERDAALIITPDETARITATSNNWLGSFGVGLGFIFPLSPHLNLQIEGRYTGLFDDDVPIRFMPISASLYF